MCSYFLESNNANIADENDDAVVPRCQDLMFYGALKDCPVCGGTVHYDGHTYICEGAYSEWSICTYSTRDPPRLEEPINFPDFVQKSAISDLLMECRDSKGKPKRELKATDKPFVGMLISLSGRLSRTHQYRKNKIEKHGGKVANHVIGVTCLVVASSFRDRGGRQKLQKHSLEPFFSAVASQFVLGQQIPFSLWLSLAPIVLGVSMASLTELSFNWLGFTSAMISNISFTYRSIYSKKAMTGMDSTNVCAYISIIALLFCLPPAILIEGPKLMQYGFRDVIAKVGMVKFVSDLFWIEMFYHLYNQIATNTNRCIKFNTSYQLPAISYQLPVHLLRV